MKKSLSPLATTAVFSVVAIVLVVVGIMVFKPSFGPGPEVKPQVFVPPGGRQVAGGENAPVGAPSGAATTQGGR